MRQAVAMSWSISVDFRWWIWKWSMTHWQWGTYKLMALVGYRKVMHYAGRISVLRDFRWRIRKKEVLVGKEPCTKASVLLTFWITFSMYLLSLNILQTMCERLLIHKVAYSKQCALAINGIHCAMFNVHLLRLMECMFNSVLLIQLYACSMFILDHLFNENLVHFSFCNILMYQTQSKLSKWIRVVWWKLPVENCIFCVSISKFRVSNVGQLGLIGQPWVQRFRYLKDEGAELSMKTDYRASLELLRRYKQCKWPTDKSHQAIRCIWNTFPLLIRRRLGPSNERTNRRVNGLE